VNRPNASQEAFRPGAGRRQKRPEEDGRVVRPPSVLHSSLFPRGRDRFGAQAMKQGEGPTAARIRTLQKHGYRGRPIAATGEGHVATATKPGFLKKPRFRT